MKTFAREVLVDFISLFYPRYCFACNEGLAKGEETVCSHCMLELPRTHYHLDRENALFRRLDGRIPLQYALAFFLFRKGGKVQRLLHALKYNNHPEIGEMLGEVYGSELKQTDFAFDLIIPVPLHASKKRLRGYNQSEEFAKGLSKGLDIPFSPDTLVRVTKTETQTRKTKLMRWQNVSEVFQIENSDRIKGRHVLLVDDVITTGATIEACALALLENGCEKLSIASIAYAEEGK